jgi:hypothetical protein
MILQAILKVPTKIIMTVFGSAPKKNCQQFYKVPLNKSGGSF